MDLDAGGEGKVDCGEAGSRQPIMITFERPGWCTATAGRKSRRIERERPCVHVGYESELKLLVHG